VSLNQINLLDATIWDDVPHDAQGEVLRQAEMMVKGTVTVALGTDLRVATTMSVFGAGGIALLAAAATLIAGTKPGWMLVSAPAIGALGLLVGAVLCARAIAPVRFLLPGVRPQSIFCTDIKDEQCLRATLIHSAERAITHNMTIMTESAEWFTLALWIAGAGILAGTGFIAIWAAGRPFF
jgi:hypothetical protein